MKAFTASNLTTLEPVLALALPDCVDSLEKASLPIIPSTILSVFFSTTNGV